MATASTVAVARGARRCCEPTARPPLARFRLSWRAPYAADPCVAMAGQPWINIQVEPVCRLCTPHGPEPAGPGGPPTARLPALPVSAGDASGSMRVLRPRGCPGFGVAESAPCPLVAAGFCEWAGG